jgi:hypothetical protein
MRKTIDATEEERNRMDSVDLKQQDAIEAMAFWVEKLVLSVLILMVVSFGTIIGLMVTR